MMPPYLVDNRLLNTLHLQAADNFERPCEAYVCRLTIISCLTHSFVYIIIKNADIVQAGQSPQGNLTRNRNL